MGLTFSYEICNPMKTAFTNFEWNVRRVAGNKQTGPPPRRLKVIQCDARVEAATINTINKKTTHASLLSVTYTISKKIDDIAARLEASRRVFNSILCGTVKHALAFNIRRTHFCVYANWVSGCFAERLCFPRARAQVFAMQTKQKCSVTVYLGRMSYTPPPTLKAFRFFYFYSWPKSPPPI